MTEARHCNRLLAIDSRNTPLAVRERDTRRNACCPHGHQVSAKGDVRSGFNGEYREPRGVYILGSYRDYAPALRRFHSPDSASPFGRGGLNAYAYCLGDPVNRVDPTGRVPWWTWAAASLIVPSILGSALGFVLGVGGVAGKVASVALAGSTVTHIGALLVPEGEVRKGLGLASFALGVVAATAAAAVARRGLVKLRARREVRMRTVDMDLSPSRSLRAAEPPAVGVPAADLDLRPSHSLATAEPSAVGAPSANLDLPPSYALLTAEPPTYEQATLNLVDQVVTIRMGL